MYSLYSPSRFEPLGGELMLITEKIESISSDVAVEQLNQIVEKAQVSISWSGRRVVSVKGFEGTVQINTIAALFLNSPVFSQKDPSIKDRLQADQLWGRVEQLYLDSDSALQSTWIYKYIVFILEIRFHCRLCAGDPEAIIREDIYKRDALFSFTEEKFKEYWGETALEGKTKISTSDSCGYVATRKMLESLPR